LFVLSARGLEFDGSVLTLKQPNPTVVYFCDRPVREAGHMTLEALVVQVQKGENNFRENPPNAAISIFEDDGSVTEVVVVLPTAPVIAGDTVKFEVVGIDGDLPAAGGAVSMFIDPIGMPLSPTSAAGVLSLPFNHSGPNSGSAQSSMADMWIATGPWDRPKVTQPSLKLWFRRGTACRSSEVAGVSDKSRPGKTQPGSDRGSDQAARRS